MKTHGQYSRLNICILCHAGDTGSVYSRRCKPHATTYSKNHTGLGVTPSAGQVMVGGAAEVAPGVTPASRDPLVGPHQPVHRTVYVLL